MLFVAVMDGALSLRQNAKHKPRRYMHDVVFSEIRRHEINSKPKNTIVMFEHGKGGMWKFWDRKIERFINWGSTHHNDLLLIGKSWGGFDIAKILNKHYKNLDYNRIHFIAVDADKMFRRGRDLYIHPVDRMVNIRQGSSMLNGAEMRLMDTINNGYPIERIDITDQKYNHMTIIEHPEVKRVIRESLEALYV